MNGRGRLATMNSNGSDKPDFAESVSAIRKSVAEEANPELIRIEALAAERGVTFLWDDDEASLGLGRYSETWPVRELPDPDSLDWDGFVQGHSDGPRNRYERQDHDRPACSAHPARLAGHSDGMSSTDYIAVNGAASSIVTTGPVRAARATCLRQTIEVDAAILETARGGLLRRGLGRRTRRCCC